ncbi:EamA family transporter [Nordella sp. HKS 07]|uniref:DMT family transporter n=1 Tax=Nordella sp. HKS 07 TaxID=2712222 RepID=UPI0013E1D0ED|nr:EamA family transporter [Nordella sp. HKS 07]QIG49279.1 EamA family transporter [Nordella sp. HKS 07]
MSDSSSRQATGILLMMAAMLSIPVVDGIAKYLSAAYSPLFLGWARYAVAGLIVLPIAALRNGRNIFPAERRGSHLLRTLFLVVSMTLYFLALARIPLATAISAFFIGPIVAVVLSIFVLKERMTWPKGVSLALGFIGAIVILRPGAALNPGILLAFGAGLCFALYLIATRWASQGSDPIKTLAFQCVVGTLLLTPQAIATWSSPQWSVLGFFLCLGLFSAFSHMMSIAAFRFAEASLLAPLVYLELLGAALIGYYAFGEIPDAFTMVGAGFIIAAGLILLKRIR